MKTRLLTIMILLTCSFVTMNIYAGMYRPGFFKFLEGDFEIPNDIKKITSSSELQPFLESNDSFIKIAAIRRLGEIEGSKAIDILSNYCTKEVSSIEVGIHPIIKLEAIRTLGRIDSERSKSLLLGLLKRYWDKGPVLSEKRNGDKKFYELDDKDFSYTVPQLLEALYKWNSDEAVFEMAKTIAQSDDVKNYYRDNIGKKAWEINLKGEMIRTGIVEEEDSIKYLLDLIEGSRTKLVENTEKKGIESIGIDSLKTAAASTILKKHSEAALSSLVIEFEEQFKKEPRTPKGFFTEHHDILRRKIGTLNGILIDKKGK